MCLASVCHDCECVTRVWGHFQFQKAGFSPETVYEVRAPPPRRGARPPRAAAVVQVHGSIHHIQCLDATACVPDIYPAAGVALSIDAATFLAAPESIPRCPAGCGRIARPNVLMFGDGGWVSTRSDAQAACYSAWVARVAAVRARVRGAARRGMGWLRRGATRWWWVDGWVGMCVRVCAGCAHRSRTGGGR